MELERIVVGIDFSPESELALEHAVALSRKTGAEILMLHARDVIELDDHPDAGNLAAREQELARERLAELRENHRGVELSHALVDGPAAEAITAATASIGASITAVGTHGRTGIRRFLLGSVAEKVVRRSTNHVLVVRPGQRPGRYRRILVATDFSDNAEKALSSAIALAEPDAEIELAHFWQMPNAIASTYVPIAGRTDAYRRLAASLEATARAKGEALIERFRDSPVSIELLIAEGLPAPGVISNAAGLDLIAMGRRGLTGLSRWLIGSVTEAVVRHAPCSVLVARGELEA